MSMNFGEILLKERTDRGLSLRAASARIGISHTYLSELETGHDPRTGQKPLPSQDVIYKICKAYELDSSVAFSLLGFKNEDEMYAYMAHQIFLLKDKNPMKYRQMLEIISEG